MTGPDIFFIYNEPLVIREHQGGQGKGDDHAKHPHQGTPYGKREKNNGGIQPGYFSHNAGNEYHVLDGLHQHKHNDSSQQDEPEVTTSIGCFQHGQDNGGNVTNDLQIGHHIQKTYQQA